MNYFVDVIVPISLPKPFTYIVSKKEFDFLDIGHRVIVPFGKSKLYTSIIIKKHEVYPKTYEPKNIEFIFDEKPLVTSDQLKIWSWISDYYLCNLGDVMRASIPSGLILSSETVFTKKAVDKSIVNSFTDDEYLIYEALQKNELRLNQINKILFKKKSLPILNRMISKGYIKSKIELFNKYKPKYIKYYRLNNRYKSKEKINDVIKEISKYSKQKDIIEFIVKTNITSESWINSSLLKKKSGFSLSSIKSLLKKGIIDEKSFQEDRVIFSEIKKKLKLKLSNVQLECLHLINEKFRKKNVVLLKGVTSSGKTEIYNELINEKLNKNKQILYLVPEISITSQMILRLQNRFGNRVIVYHSKYSNNERVEMWKLINENNKKAKIILGARSSILLPFRNLGLIIVDEEHDNSFKQFDPSPRYNARDLAVYMGYYLDIKVILGSATPSIESFYNVKKGKYEYVELLERYGGVRMPEISCIDLKRSYNENKMEGFFSKDLLDEINATLNKNKQIILFQNRRGYSPILECVKCGNIPQCKNCDVSLTYHQFNNEMKCHYCGFKLVKPTKCDSCGFNDLNSKGIGTQQIQEQIQDFFPKVNVGRMDWDTTRGKKSFEKIIKKFVAGEIKILVGTQMITKGLDFREVGLVGVIKADSLISFPDFRAHERSFQTLIQVAGRSGRSSERGRVIIQTFNPESVLLKQIVDNDFQGMYDNEIKERIKYLYPPFNRLIKITLKSKDYSNVDSSSIWMANYLKQFLKNKILGPVSPEISKIRNLFLKQILVKYSNTGDRENTKKIISTTIKSFGYISVFRQVRVSIDVDPY